MAKEGKGKEKLIRICVLGAAFSGKSTLCNRFVNNFFEWMYEPTVEPGIFRSLVNITGDEEHQQYCMLQIEDLFPINHPFLQLPKGESTESDNMMTFYENVIGNKRHEKKKSNEKPLFKETGIHGYMYVFDLNSQESYAEVVNVIEYIHNREEKEAGKKRSGLASKILVGTKKDLTGTQPAVSQTTIDQLKKKYTLMFRRVSALTNTEVTECFLDLARNAIDRDSGNGNDEGSGDEGGKGGFFGMLGCGNRDKSSGGCAIS